MKYYFIYILLTLSFPTLGQEKIIERPLTIERVQNYIQNNNIDNIEDLLAALPEDYRHNYTLMYKSNSLQVATAENPRVLLYGKTTSSRYDQSDAQDNLIISFNGDPKQQGFDQLEMVEFKNNKFIFGEIQFKGDAQKIKENNPDYTIPSGNHQADTSGKKCIKCHGDSEKPELGLRPNWEVYNRWPGAMPSGDTAIGIEQKYLADFQKKVNEQKEQGAGRYRFLDGGDNYTTSGYSFNFSSLSFTEKLNKLNMSRIMNEFKSSPNYKAYREVLLANILGCKDISSFIPNLQASELDSFSSQVYEDQRKYLEPLVKRQIALSEGKDRYEDVDEHKKLTPQKLSDRVFALMGDLGSIKASKRQINLGFLSKKMGVDSSIWSMAFGNTQSDSNLFLFRDPDIGIGQATKILLDEYKKDAPEFYQFLKNNTHVNSYSFERQLGQNALRNPSKTFCNELKKRSLDVLKDINKPQMGCNEHHSLDPIEESRSDIESIAEAVQGNLPKKPKVINKCVGCHSNPNSNYIPFDNQVELARLFDTQKWKDRNIEQYFKEMTDKNATFRMPLASEALEESEVSELLKYVKEIENSLLD